MFKTCESCDCLTMKRVMCNNLFVCDYCYQEAEEKRLRKRSKKVEPEYPTFITEFKKKYRTKANFARMYKLNVGTVQVILRPNRQTKLTKLQRRVYTILVRRGFGKLLVMDAYLTTDELLDLAFSL